MNDMGFEEKNVWLYGLITLVTTALYTLTVLSRSRGVPLVETAYIGPMIWCIGAAIVLSIIGHILMAILWPREADKKDIRDKEIEQFGEYAGQVFLVIGGVSAMILAMIKADHFWIANAVYLCFALSSLLSSAVKIVAYRRGIPLC
jgi:hypothetical protein